MISGSFLKYKDGLKSINPLFQTMSLSETTLSELWNNRGAKSNFKRSLRLEPNGHNVIKLASYVTTWFFKNNCRFRRDPALYFSSWPLMTSPFLNLPFWCTCRNIGWHYLITMRLQRGAKDRQWIRIYVMATKLTSITAHG